MPKVFSFQFGTHLQCSRFIGRVYLSSKETRVLCGLEFQSLWAEKAKYAEKRSVIRAFMLFYEELSRVNSKTGWNTFEVRTFELAF